MGFYWPDWIRCTRKPTVLVLFRNLPSYTHIFNFLVCFLGAPVDWLVRPVLTLLIKSMGRNVTKVCCPSKIIVYVYMQ